MNSDNSKTYNSHRLFLNLSDKINLKRSHEYVPLSNLNIYYSRINIKKSSKNNKFIISAPTRNGKFESPDGSYSALEIQDFFEYIIKKPKEVTDNPSTELYVNKTKNRIIFRIKTGFYIEFLTSQTMKLLASTKNKITMYENGENVPHLEITNVVIVHCNIVNNDYQHDSRVLHTFVSNKLFGRLLVISPKNLIVIKNI